MKWLIIHYLSIVSSFPQLSPRPAQTSFGLKLGCLRGGPQGMQRSYHFLLGIIFWHCHVFLFLVYTLYACDAFLVSVGHNIMLQWLCAVAPKGKSQSWVVLLPICLFLDGFLKTNMYYLCVCTSSDLGSGGGVRLVVATSRSKVLPFRSTLRRPIYIYLSLSLSLYIYIYIHICIHVCMYVCMYVCR